MVRWVRSWFAWRRVFVAGVWLYEENAVTGRRRASRINRGGYSPVAFDWLDAGIGHPLINHMPAWRSAEGQVSGRYCH